MQLFLRERVTLRRWYLLAKSHTIELQLKTVRCQLLSTEGVNSSVENGAMILHPLQIENYLLNQKIEKLEHIYIYICVYIYIHTHTHIYTHTHTHIYNFLD